MHNCKHHYHSNSENRKQIHTERHIILCSSTISEYTKIQLNLSIPDVVHYGMLFDPTKYYSPVYNFNEFTRRFIFTCVWWRLNRSFGGYNNNKTTKYKISSDTILLNKILRVDLTIQIYIFCCLLKLPTLIEIFKTPVSLDQCGYGWFHQVEWHFNFKFQLVIYFCHG